MFTVHTKARWRGLRYRGATLNLGSGFSPDADPDTAQGGASHCRAVAKRKYRIAIEVQGAATFLSPFENKARSALTLFTASGIGMPCLYGRYARFGIRRQECRRPLYFELPREITLGESSNKKSICRPPARWLRSAAHSKIEHRAYGSLP